jgi:polar amino acid transport system substrate-binding protein
VEHYKPVGAFALAGLLWVFPTPAPADTISLTSGEQYPPFTGSSLTDGGVLTELVRLAFAAAGHTTKVDFKPWTRGYEETLRLQYSATYPYLSTGQREADFLFSDPLYQLNLRLYVQYDSLWQSGSQEELKDATFCLPAGYEVSGWVHRERDRLTFVRPRSMDQCRAMLQLGRTDVMISNPDEVAWNAQGPHLIPRNVRKLPEPVDDVTLHLIVPRAHPQAQTLLDEFNAGLRQVTINGVRDRLFNDYPDSQRDQRPSD